MKRTLAILALAAVSAAPALAGPLDGVPVLGSVNGITVYSKPCLSVVNKGEQGFIGVRGQQAACVIEEGNYTNRVEWIASGKVERIRSIPARAPVDPAPAQTPPGGYYSACVGIADAANLEACQAWVRREDKAKLIRQWSGG